MKVLILGKSGQVGRELLAQWQCNSTLQLCAPDRQQLDLRDFYAVRQLIAQFRPAVVINAAAFTLVDACENQVSQAYLINTSLLNVLAKSCQQLAATLIHLSSDYVFDGQLPLAQAYVERDQTNSINIYGKSKQAGEEGIRQTLNEHYILRTSWLYSQQGNNFARTMLTLAARPVKGTSLLKEQPQKQANVLKVVNDQIGAPTDVTLLVKVITYIIAGLTHKMNSAAAKSSFKNTLPFGTYHLCAGGQTSWFGFAQFLIQGAYVKGLIEEVPEMQGITSEDYARLFGVTTLRPKNSQLNCQKIQSYLPFSLPHWQVGAQQWLDAQTSLMADTQTTADLKANNTGQS